MIKQYLSNKNENAIVKEKLFGSEQPALPVDTRQSFFFFMSLNWLQR